MNKSRRLVREAGVRLAAAEGYVTVVPDLFGCGDSEGEIEQATMALWNRDLQLVVEWARDAGISRFSALAVRAGAIFLEGMRRHVDLQRVVAWQPVDGTQTLRDLLRVQALNLKMGGDHGGGKACTLDDLKQEGKSHTLSGYCISSALARGMLESDTSFEESRPDYTRIQFGGESDDAAVVVVNGERFWRALEPGVNEALVASTVDLFAGR